MSPETWSDGLPIEQVGKANDWSDGLPSEHSAKAEASRQDDVDAGCGAAAARIVVLGLAAVLMLIGVMTRGVS